MERRRLGPNLWAGIALMACLGAVGGPALLRPGVAKAAPTCGSTAQPPAGAVEASEPWTQRRFDYQRLLGIADGSGQKIAVIDSGVNATHPQLVEAVLPGFDALDASGNGQLDCVGHGTAVASVIAARPAKGVAFRGVAPASKILPFRVSERQATDGQPNAGRVDGFANAVNQAVAARVSVINISMVVSVDTPALRQAIANAIAKDVVVVAAAGNAHDRGDPTPYPATYPGVIGVGAVNERGARLDTSQVGPYVDLVAPGSLVMAATPGGGHGSTFEGTSFATPFVAGAAALVRQYHPQLSAAAVAARLVATADPSPGGPKSDAYGGGVVNPYRAVTAQLGGEAASLAPLPPRDTRADAATARRTARTRHVAFGVAGGLGACVLLVVGCATVVPAGRRRGWRPGARAGAADRPATAVAGDERWGAPRPLVRKRPVKWPV